MPNPNSARTSPLVLRPFITHHPLWSKPGPPTWELLFFRQLRLQQMLYLRVQGNSYRAIAKEMGLARTTVMRMADEAAGWGILNARDMATTSHPGPELLDILDRIVTGGGDPRPSRATSTTPKPASSIPSTGSGHEHRA